MGHGIAGIHDNLGIVKSVTTEFEIGEKSDSHSLRQFPRTGNLALRVAALSQ
jgi:hypothetical protein